MFFEATHEKACSVVRTLEQAQTLAGRFAKRFAIILKININSSNFWLKAIGKLKIY
jgi:hypothetical protein